MGFQHLKFKLFVIVIQVTWCVSFLDWKSGWGEGLVQILKAYANLKFASFTLENAVKIYYF